ncbi:glycosyl transferase [Lysinibacillus sp. HST-98]|uniref:glycosyl transferase n=1 Tax=Lysinibacillus sp. HST-98 TaxID=2800419 RepID=UPI001929328D|nr:glycosyl transferase [Lysinibacillus sp. HST-98]MBL3728340.1 glycosyl transferase [Lysinibacillus sp. HST-98]
MGSYKEILEKIAQASKILLLLIVSTIFLFGCSNTIVAELAIVNEVNKNSIVIENLSGKTAEIAISPTNDFIFEENEEYFFRYEVLKSKKAVLISVESIEN